MTTLVNNTVSHQRNRSLSHQALQKQTMRWGSMCKWLIKDGLPEGTGREKEGRPGQRRKPKQGAASDKVLQQRQLLLRGTLGSELSLKVVRPEARGSGFHLPHSFAWWGPPGGVNPQGLPPSIPHVLGSTSSGQGQLSKEELRWGHWRQKDPEGREGRSGKTTGVQDTGLLGEMANSRSGQERYTMILECFVTDESRKLSKTTGCEKVKRPTLRGSHYPETGQFEHQS